GHLGTMTSSARFQRRDQADGRGERSAPRAEASNFPLQPELDPDGIPRFGLVAEEVEKVNPDLVMRDADGKVNTVRYEAVNAMLLNEFLKEHRRVQEQQRTIAELKASAAQQQRQIEALTAGLQKVNHRIELAAPNPKLVVD
ncbi:MAG: hypothetical protein ABI883_03825, partial [Chthoniobacterales bacterium]